MRDLAARAREGIITCPLSRSLPRSEAEPSLSLPYPVQGAQAGSAQLSLTSQDVAGPMATLPICVLDKGSSCHLSWGAWATHCQVFSTQGSAQVLLPRPI